MTEPEAPAPESAHEELDDEPTGMNPAIKIAAVFTLLGGAMLFLAFSSASDVATYSATVAEVREGQVDTNGARRLRVEGDLRHGTIQFREQPCEWRFTIERDGAEMDVRFPQCVVPDTFRDDYDIEVVVEGRMEGEVFLADQIIPRCPSRYEEQAQAGS